MFRKAYEIHYLTLIMNKAILIKYKLMFRKAYTIHYLTLIMNTLTREQTDDALRSDKKMNEIKKIQE